jgi:tripartite motif-containing protein 71
MSGARNRYASLAAAAAALALLAAAPPVLGGYSKTHSFGSAGSGSGQFGSGRAPAQFGNRQFNSVGGIATRAGKVYVADPSNSRIERFSTSGRFQAKFGRLGFETGAANSVGAKNGFVLPEGVALDSSGHVYVADNRNDRVMKYTATGRFLKRIASRGSASGQVVSPWGVAIKGSDLYVVDQGNYRISRYSTSGARRGSFGTKGLKTGQLIAPYAVAVGAGGTVLVTENVRDIVLRYSASGHYLGYFGGTGTGRGELRSPTGIAVRKDGSILVADCANKRVNRYSADGTFIESFGKGALDDPTFLAVDSANRVYVSDNRRVVTFAPSGSSRAVARASTVGPTTCRTDATAA